MNDTFIARLGECIELLYHNFAEQLPRATESESHFSLRVGISPATLTQASAPFITYVDLLHLSLEFKLQEASGICDLDAAGNFVIVQWELDDSLTPPALTDPAAETMYADLTSALGQSGASLSPGRFASDLAQLDQAGADLELTLSLRLDKLSLISMMGCPPQLCVVLYVSTAKFLQLVQRDGPTFLDTLLVPNGETGWVLMLGDLQGTGVGPNLCVCGPKHWGSSTLLTYRPTDFAVSTVTSAIRFRNEECNWQIANTNVTPYHFHLDRLSLSPSDIGQVLGYLRDSLSVAYLADQLEKSGEILVCQFRGYKRVQVTLPRSGTEKPDSSLFALFAWAYENNSADKLEIVRQIVSLNLEHSSGDSYLRLLEKARDILGAAKGNFQVLLRGNAESYFDKRLKVSEFLQKFTSEVGKSVSAMTSELIANLYKTVGVLIGVVLAAIADPRLIPAVVHWSSIFYLAYILLIILYQLPSIVLTYIDREAEYKRAVSQMEDILSNYEIDRLEGKTFRRARRLFWIYFIVTLFLYLVLAGVAIIFMRTYSTP